MLTTINPESYAGICWDIPLAIEELEAEQGNPKRVLQNQRFKSLFVSFKCNDCWISERRVSIVGIDEAYCRPFCFNGNKGL